MQALQNGEVDIIAPQATADTVTALEALDGVTVDSGRRAVLRPHRPDFSRRRLRGPERPRGVPQDVPRQEIVDKIIKPLDPEAELLNSQLFVPGRPRYDDSVAEQRLGRYAEVDIEGAKALLAGAHARRPHHVQHEQPQPRRGVRADPGVGHRGRLQDRGRAAREDWGAHLGTASTTPSSSAGSRRVSARHLPQIFTTRGGTNFNQLREPEVDALWTRSSTTDTEGQATSSCSRSTQSCSPTPTACRFPGPGRGRAQRPHRGHDLHGEPDRCVLELLGVDASADVRFAPSTG